MTISLTLRNHTVGYSSHEFYWADKRLIQLLSASLLKRVHHNLEMLVLSLLIKIGIHN